MTGATSHTKLAPDCKNMNRTRGWREDWTGNGKKLSTMFIRRPICKIEKGTPKTKCAPLFPSAAVRNPYFERKKKIMRKRPPNKARCWSDTVTILSLAFTIFCKNGASITKSLAMYTETRMERILPRPDAKAYSTAATSQNKIINKSQLGECQLKLRIKCSSSMYLSIFCFKTNAISA